MNRMFKFKHPQTLYKGKFYFYRESSVINIQETQSLVIFEGYTACPALVVIRDKSGNKIRCSRDNLIEINVRTPRPASLRVIFPIIHLLIYWKISITKNLLTY